MKHIICLGEVAALFKLVQQGCATPSDLLALSENDT
jgi:hypothetical protein